MYVVSSGEKVELVINGESAGFGNRIYHYMFTFDSIAWDPGKIEAVSYDRTGNVLSKDYIETSGEPSAVKLSLMQDPNGLLANGADLALIEAEIVDAKGRRCPVAFNMLEFELEGAAEWIGGMAQGPDNYILSESLPAECGVNRVLVRSLTSPGEIKLIAKSGELKSDTLVFKSQAVKVENGLSSGFPSDNLPANLEKGPTPSTPSFTESRMSIRIINASAGSNQENAALSFDGKQSTRWVNDGKLETGWIEYTLEKKARIDEIALKLSGWRTRSYPIVVTANDSILFRGVTQPNLGFFYITPETPVETDNLKVRLFGQTEFKDAYQLVEITGQLDRETANDMAVRNVTNLNIAEIEIFGKVK
jgi:hypothetical protein